MPTDDPLFAPKIWNRVRLESSTDKDDEEIDATINKMNAEDELASITIPVSQGKDQKKPDADDDIPPERKKPIPYALEPRRLEEILLIKAPLLKYPRSDVIPLILACYLSAARIKEILQLRVSDVFIEEEDGLELLKFNLTTEKRKKRKNRDGIFVKPIPPRRVVPVAMNAGLCNELTMVKVFMKHYEQYSGDEFLFCLSDRDEVLLDRTSVENRLLDNERCLAHYYFHRIDFGPIKVMKWYPREGYREQKADTYLGYPHYLRHNRLTHLSSYYRCSDEELMKIAGWTNTEMAATYVHLSASDIARHMAQRIREVQGG
jgi:integrase